MGRQGDELAALKVADVGLGDTLVSCYIISKVFLIIIISGGSIFNQ